MLVHALVPKKPNKKTINDRDLTENIFLHKE